MQSQEKLISLGIASNSGVPFIAGIPMMVMWTRGCARVDSGHRSAVVPGASKGRDRYGTAGVEAAAGVNEGR